MPSSKTIQSPTAWSWSSKLSFRIGNWDCKEGEKEWIFVGIFRVLKDGNLRDRGTCSFGVCGFSRVGRDMVCLIPEV